MLTQYKELGLTDADDAMWILKVCICIMCNTASVERSFAQVVQMPSGLTEEHTDDRLFCLDQPMPRPAEKGTEKHKTDWTKREAPPLKWQIDQAHISIARLSLSNALLWRS